MKIVFACRRSPASIFIARALHERGHLNGLIVEEGRRARREKLWRMFRHRPLINLPIRLLDLFFLWRMERVVRRHFREHLIGGTAADFPVAVETLACDDCNDRASVDALKRFAPDVLIVFGTAMLRNGIFDLGIKDVLNIHCGIVPAYRGVHSEFWALSRNDLAMIGTTILHLTRGVDSGAIALQERLAVTKGEALVVVRERNIRLAADLINKAVDLIREGALPHYPQDEREAHILPTPGFADWTDSGIRVV